MPVAEVDAGRLTAREAADVLGLSLRQTGVGEENRISRARRGREWGLISQPLLTLSGFLEAHRREYYHRLLAVSQRGEWEKWLLFFLRGISSQSLDAITRIERLGNLRAAYRERLCGERAAARLMQTVDVLFERPILNIRQLEAALGVPYRTAQRYVERLQAVGIVEEVTGRARNRVYRADEILGAIEGP